MRFMVLISKSPNGKGYWAMVPALPGCFSTGDTFEAAQENVTEAIGLQTRGMLQDGEELPGEDVFIVAQVDVDVKLEQVESPS